MTAARPLYRLALLLLLLAGVALLSLSGGTRFIPPARILQALLHFNPQDFTDRIIVDLRLLHLGSACLVGAALGVAGQLLQAVIRNPLGEPHILGLNAGAALAVVICTACGLSATATSLRPLVAAAGAGMLFSLVMLFSCAGRCGLTLVKVMLCGVTLSAFAASLTATVLLLDEQTLQSVSSWLAGDLSGLSWPALRAALWPFSLAVVLALWLSPALNALQLGDALAVGMGVRLQQTRIIAIAAVALLSGTAVALAGPIGFIGLVVPNLIRRLITRDLRLALPCSALGGALILILADSAARTMLAPRDIATGVMTAVVGAPVFIIMAARYFK